MKYEKPDGIIELGGSGCCCPPGARRQGMHTNATTTWYRVGGGEWVHTARYSHTRTLAAAAETVAEFLEAMKDSHY